MQITAHTREQLMAARAEAAVQQQLQHPHLLQLLAFGITDTAVQGPPQHGSTTLRLTPQPLDARAGSKASGFSAVIGDEESQVQSHVPGTSHATSSSDLEILVDPERFSNRGRGAVPVKGPAGNGLGMQLLSGVDRSDDDLPAPVRVHLLFPFFPDGTLEGELQRLSDAGEALSCADVLDVFMQVGGGEGGWR